MNQPFQDIPNEYKYHNSGQQIFIAILPMRTPREYAYNRAAFRCRRGEELSGTYWCLSPSPSFSSRRTIGFHLIVIAGHTSLPCPASRFVFALTPLFHSYLVISPSYSLFSDLLSRRLRTCFWRDINATAGRFIVRDLIWIHHQHSCKVNFEYLRCKIITFEYLSVACLLTGCIR